MEFAIIAWDGQDEGALERRLSVREKHMAMVERYRPHMVHGGAMLDDAGRMIGSILIVQFPDREAFDAWYSQDPYVTGNVWQDVQVVPFRTAPPFATNIPQLKGASA